MWSQFVTQMQTQPWLHAAVIGTVLWVVLWLVDHVGAHLIVRYILVGTPTFRRNMVGILRRVLLLCAAGLLAVSDYLVLVPSHWQSRFSLALVALPIAAVIVVVWLVVESALMSHVVLGDTTLRSWWQQQQQAGVPGAIGQEPRLGWTDFLRLPPAQKQRVYGSDAYGAPSQRLNCLLYLLTWAHLVGWVYALRTGIPA